MKFRWLDRRGISPIFATMILVAIVVIFGSAVYYYASNLTNAATNNYVSSLSGSQQAVGERINFENVVYNQSTSTLRVYIINCGMTNNVNISSVFIYDLNNNIVGSPYFGSSISGFHNISTGALIPPSIGLNAGKEAYFDVSKVKSALLANLTPGSTYSLKLATQRGTSFNYEFTA